jgi:hypothetical protein
MRANCPIGYDRSDPREYLSSHALGLGPQSTALLFTEWQSAAAQPLAQDAILLAQVLDDLQLTSVHPASNPMTTNRKGSIALLSVCRK